MKTYAQLKEEHHKETVESFGGTFFISYSYADFCEGMKKMGLDPERDLDKVSCSLFWLGTVILKDKSEEYKAMLFRHQEEITSLRKSRKELKASLVRVLCKNGHNTTEALKTLNITKRDVPADILRLAKKDALKHQIRT